MTTDTSDNSPNLFLANAKTKNPPSKWKWTA